VGCGENWLKPKVKSQLDNEGVLDEMDRIRSSPVENGNDAATGGGFAGVTADLHPQRPINLGS